MRFSQVSLESWGFLLPDRQVSSRDIEARLDGFMKRHKLPSGFFELFTGIKERRLWDATTKPSDKGIESATIALNKEGISPDSIDCLIHVSVSRDSLEPATAATVHHGLGLKETAFFFDVSNACLGFLNGALLLASMIEGGHIKRGLLVGTEISTHLVDSIIEQLNNDSSMTIETAYELIPTLTLGCGSAAMILSHKDVSKTSHAFLGALPQGASQFHNLCTAVPDTGIVHAAKNLSMKTNANKLMIEAMALAKKSWPHFLEHLDWKKEAVNHIFSHQVGREPREAMIQALGVGKDLDFPTFPTLGNMGSVSLPVSFAIGAKKRAIKSGDKIALLGFGSGINTIFAGVQW